MKDDAAPRPVCGWDCAIVHVHTTKAEAEACLAESVRQRCTDPFEIEAPEIDMKEIEAHVQKHLDSLKPDAPESDEQDRR